MQALSDYGDDDEARAMSGVGARYTSFYEHEASVRPEHEAVLRIAALVEVFFHERMLAGKSYYLGQPGSSIQKWQGGLSKADRSWEGRRAVWEELFGVTLDDCDDYVPYLGLVEVRNSIAHRLGWLTELQLSRSVEVGDNLKSLGVGVIDGRVVVTPPVVRASAHIACGLVDWVDRRSPF